MSEELHAPEGEKLEPANAAAESAAPQSPEQAEPAGLIVQVSDEADDLSSLLERLDELTAHRDRQPVPELIDDEPNPEFIPRRDCDRLFAAGTIVDIAGVPCRLLIDSPVMSATFRNEAIFAEALAHSGAGLAANAPGLWQRYNGNGVPVGVNEDHGYNRLIVEIAAVEAAIEAKQKAEIEAVNAKLAEENAKAEPKAE